MEKRDRDDRGANAPRRKSLRDEVAEIDQEILRLLIKRHNLLGRMKDRRGDLDAAEEKFLREAWQGAVAKVSRDAALSGRFFSFLQEVSFLPRPEKAVENPARGADRRDAFSLAPPRMPVNIQLAAPASSFCASSWLYLGTASGASIELANCLMNDAEVDLAKALGQMGGAITREPGKIFCRAAQPLQAPDKVLHLGDSFYNLYLVLAHYLGRPSRVKLSGDAALKMADLSFLHPLLLQCGARLAHIVPKSAGLPARLECSGLLPAGIEFGPELPGELACALMLAAIRWKQPFGIDLRKHPQQKTIFAKILPILEQGGAVFQVDGGAISIEPSSLSLPPKPAMPVEPLLCAALLAFAMPCGGQVELAGQWPDWPECQALWRLLLAMGLKAEKTPGQLCVAADRAPIVSPASLPPDLTIGVDEDFLPLPLALAAVGALNGENMALPRDWPLKADSGDFMRAAGLEISENGELKAAPPGNVAPIYNAPDAAFAMSLALAAMAARKTPGGARLGNPGIMTTLWPGFWSFYNGLPNPGQKRREEAAPPKTRRRIRTASEAILPDMKDDDEA